MISNEAGSKDVGRRDVLDRKVDQGANLSWESAPLKIDGADCPHLSDISLHDPHDTA